MSRFDSIPRRRVWLSVAAASALLLLARRDGVSAIAPPATRPAVDAELRRAAERSDLCSSSNVVGTGLRGEYFAQNAKQKSPLFVRTDPTVDFDATFDRNETGVRQRLGSARWTGWVKPPVSGIYRFHADQPLARLVVSRQVMVGADAASSASIELAAGRFYPIVLEVDGLYEMKGRLRLEWTAPHGARFLVPRALLFVPNENALATKS